METDVARCPRDSDWCDGMICHDLGYDEGIEGVGREYNADTSGHMRAVSHRLQPSHRHKRVRVMATMDGRPSLGSATPHLSVLGQRMPWGGPRFHPPGEHPATYAYRQQRAKIADLLNRTSPFTYAYRQGCEALAYVDQKLAEFEAGEMEAKRRAWHYLRDRNAR